MPLLADGIRLPDGIELLETASGAVVVGEIVPLHRELAKREIDQEWWERVRHLPKERLRAEWDRGWQWHKLIGTLRTLYGTDGYAWGVRAANRIQGAVLYYLNAASTLDPAQLTVFVPNLAAAPSNRGRLVSEPEFLGVGSGLLRFAACHSERAGFGGRLTLDAYPDPRLVSWYTGFGFRVTGTAPDGISVLELPPEAAASQLVRSGFSP